MCLCCKPWLSLRGPRVAYKARILDPYSSHYAEVMFVVAHYGFYITIMKRLFFIKHRVDAIMKSINGVKPTIKHCYYLTLDERLRIFEKLLYNSCNILTNGGLKNDLQRYRQQIFILNRIIQIVQHLSMFLSNMVR